MEHLLSTGLDDALCVCVRVIRLVWRNQVPHVFSAGKAQGMKAHRRRPPAQIFHVELELFGGVGRDELEVAEPGSLGEDVLCCGWVQSEVEGVSEDVEGRVKGSL